MLKKGMYYICSPLSASTKEEIQKNMEYAKKINNEFAIKIFQYIFNFC